MEGVALSPGEQRTQDVVPALQLEGVFAAAQVVDVVSQPVHVVQTLRHHHLLVHQVGLWQVCSGLGTRGQMGTMIHLSCTEGRVLLDVPAAPGGPGAP